MGWKQRFICDRYWLAQDPPADQHVVALISFLWRINWSGSMKDPGSRCVALIWWQSKLARPAWTGCDWSQNKSMRSIEKEGCDNSKDRIKIWLFYSMEIPQSFWLISWYCNSGYFCVEEASAKYPSGDCWPADSNNPLLTIRASTLIGRLSS